MNTESESQFQFISNEDDVPRNVRAEEFYVDCLELIYGIGRQKGVDFSEHLTAEQISQAQD